MFDRLRRVTDLFVEGTEMYLGDDDRGEPVVVWVNKLNSFEVEEARRDAVAARGLRLLELEKEDNPERQAMMLQVHRWDEGRLKKARVDQVSDELYMAAISDLEADEEWADNIATLRRLPTLLRDENAPKDDKRWAQFDELNQEYLSVLQDRLSKLQDEKTREFDQLDRETLVDDFMESWRSRLSLDEFMQEKRRTELFFALRDCKASRVKFDGGERWEHQGCDHTVRLMESRGQVSSLPEGIIERAMDVMDGVTVPQREAGNSDAPASSSASSEQPSEEGASVPSIREETPPVAPTT
jgi:hypothetical protein